MNPFAEDVVGEEEEEVYPSSMDFSGTQRALSAAGQRPLVSRSSSASSTPSGSGRKDVDYGIVGKRKQQVTTLSSSPGGRNPFAEDIQSSFRHSGSSSRGNPFQPLATSDGANPFAPGAVEGDSVRVDVNSFAPSAQSSSAQTFRLTTLEHRENSLKHMSIGDNLALVVTQAPGSGDVVITRREISSFHKTDGVIPLKDSVETIFLDPKSAYALLMLKAAKTMQKDAIFFISPQDATLKARGPLPALTGMTSATWFEDHGEQRALIGSASGVVQIARFSHNGLADLNMFCSLTSSNPVIAIVAKGGSVLVLDTNGFYQVFQNEISIGEGVLQGSGRTGRVEPVTAIGDDEGDFWILSNRGLHRLNISSAPTTTEIARGSVVIKAELVYEQEHCFAITHTRLFVLLLSRHVPNRQSNAVSTKLVAVSKITLRVIPTLEKSKITIHGSPPIGFARDDARGNAYAYSEKGVCHVEIAEETKGAWKEYLSRAQSTENDLDFVRALEFCERKRDRDVIRAAQAEWNLARGRYVHAAELFSQVSTSVRSFEEIALALANAPDIGVGEGGNVHSQREKKKALRIYLLGKLEKVGDSQKTLRTMLSTWICEAFLDELDRFEASPRAGEGNQQDMDQEQDIIGAFCAFLGSHSSSLDPAKEVVFHLILSHGRIDILLVYAHLTKDYDRVVTYHMHRDAPKEAVRALREFADEDPEAACALFYKHSPTLIIQCPETLVEAWLAQPALEPSKLVPALSRFEEGDETVRTWAIKYLEHCVDVLGVRDEAVHNLLLTAYASDENKLYRFVKRETSQPGGFCFDPGFALRLCSRLSPRSRISLLDSMNMPEAACVAALEQGLPDVAQRIANDQSVTRGNDELAKRLWILCCKDALKDITSPTARAIEVLHASNGILSVEDLLLLLPDTVKMDEFRDEVCMALEKYNSEIQRLKGEMDENTESAQALRRDAADEKRRFDVVRAAKCCDLCGKRIFVDSAAGGDPTHQPILYTLASGVDEFYVFPCTHIFHSRCLYDQFIRRFRGEKADHLARLAVSDSEEDQAYLEEVLGANCPLCGEAMIMSVSHPLVLAQDEAEAISWE